MLAMDGQITFDTGLLMVILGTFSAGTFDCSVTQPAEIFPSVETGPPVAPPVMVVPGNILPVPPWGAETSAGCFRASSFVIPGPTIVDPHPDPPGPVTEVLAPSHGCSGCVAGVTRSSSAPLEPDSDPSVAPPKPFLFRDPRCFRAIGLQADVDGKVVRFDDRDGQNPARSFSCACRPSARRCCTRTSRG